MNSCERFITAISKNDPDHVPMDVYGAELVVIEKLQKYFNVSTQEDVYQCLQSDFRTAWVDIPVEYYKGPLQENQGTGHKISYWGTPLPEDSFHPTPYGDTISPRPLQNASTLREIERYPWPDPDLFDFNAMASDCRNFGDRVVRIVSGPLFNRVCELVGMEKTLIDLIDQPKIIEAITEKITEFYCALYDNFLPSGSGWVNVFSFWDDVATKQGLFFSLELWRKFFKRPLSKIFRTVKKYKLKVQYHCCGNMKVLIPDLLDIGMDILEPCQFHLRGMDPGILKREFGRDLTFFGGINTQHTLPFGTSEEVRNEVRDRIDTVGRNGGYILAPDHVIKSDVPVRNIVAMFEEGLSYKTTG